MKITARHLEGYKFELDTERGVIRSDQSPQYGGDGTGLMPSELFLCSLGSCLGQAVAYIAKKKRLELKGLTLEVEAEKDQEFFRYNHIRVRVQSDNADNVLGKVLELAKKYCFVSNTLNHGPEIQYSVEEKNERS